MVKPYLTVERRPVTTGNRWMHFAPDDIRVRAVPALFFESVQATADAIVLTWSAVPGVTYHFQCAAAADNSTALPQRFYRIVEKP